MLEDYPSLQIDWGLRNMQHQTPLDVAQDLHKGQIAAWIQQQMEGHAVQPMYVDSE